MTKIGKIAGLLVGLILGCEYVMVGTVEASVNEQQDEAGILKIRHNLETGVTTINVETNKLSPYSCINIFRSETPITPDNILFCPRVACLSDDSSSASVKVADSGTFFYALTTSDRYKHQNKLLLEQTRVGPVTEVCRTPPLPPIPSRHCVNGQLYLQWSPEVQMSLASYRVYQQEGSDRKLVGNLPVPDTTGTMHFKIPIPLADGQEYSFFVTSVNSSGLESMESAPVKIANLPDLEVAQGETIAKNPDFSIEKMFPLVGKPVKVSVRVHNRGLVAAHGVKVSLSAYHDKSATSTKLKSWQVDIDRDASVLLDLVWVPEQLGEFHLKAVVDPANQIAEFDKGNNQAEVLVPVVKRDVYVVWYGNPLEVNWCNVPGTRSADLKEWKRRGAFGSFCGMIEKNDKAYRKHIKGGFDGVAVDEIGSHDAPTLSFIKWLTALKTDNPNFFVGLWMAGSLWDELAANEKIDLYIGENYYNIGTPPSVFDGHIKDAKKYGVLNKYVFGLGGTTDNASRHGHTYTLDEQAAFIESEMKYIAENAPEMPGIGLYGCRPGLSTKIDPLCYQYFVAPQFKQ